MSTAGEPVPTPDTERLLERSSQGDQAALEALLARYLPGLVAYVRKQAGKAIVVHESATDIAHSACREVLAALADEGYRFHGEDHFRAWLFQAALRKIQDRARHWRREKRDPARLQPIDSAQSRMLEGVMTALSPSEHAIGAEERAQLLAAIEQLDPRQREVVSLAYEMHLSHREIAARLEIEESHSRTLLARALARLARLMAR